MCKVCREAEEERRTRNKHTYLLELGIIAHMCVPNFRLKKKKIQWRLNLDIKETKVRLTPSKY